jgi:hypothetical protein
MVAQIFNMFSENWFADSVFIVHVTHCIVHVKHCTPDTVVYVLYILTFNCGQFTAVYMLYIAKYTCISGTQIFCLFY